MAFVQSEISERAKINSDSEFKPVNYYHEQNRLIDTCIEKLTLAEKSETNIEFNQGLISYVDSQIINATLDENINLLSTLKKQLKRLSEINSLVINNDLNGVVEKTSTERMFLKLTENPEVILSGAFDFVKNIIPK